MTSPSSGTDGDRPTRANFRLLWEIFVAPERAFDRIANHPEWVLATLVIVLLIGVSDYADFPASAHVLIALGHKYAVEKPTPAFLWEETVIECALTIVKMMVTAAALTMFAGFRDAKKMIAYPAFLSLAANATVIAASGEFLSNVAVLLRSPASFSDIRSLSVALPLNLAIFAEPGNIEQAQFLSHYGVFSIWADIVLAFGFSKLAKVKIVPSLVFVFTLELMFPFFLGA